MMFKRLVSPILSHSFFMFGSRGTGKTTWLKEKFSKIPHIWINLLDPQEEEKYLLYPQELSGVVSALPEETKWIVIDEVQKAPKLLDLVHLHIEQNNILFALTGSSARKLKRGKANLLAGRAFVNSLHPMTHLETGEVQTVEQALMWGALPAIFGFKNDLEKTEYLRAYAQTYLSQEIIAEQLVRALVPFRRFLQVVAQSNGKLINYSRMARDVGSDHTTIKSYFEILEETHIGFYLYPFHSSFRKRLNQHPKFYIFDLGVTRALSKTLDIPVRKSTSTYGDAFEHFIILEFYRICSYKYPDAQLSYIQTKDGAEVDLVLEMPGQPVKLIEIKSTECVLEQHISTLNRFLKDLPNAQGFCLSQDPNQKKIGGTLCLSWREGIKEILGL